MLNKNLFLNIDSKKSLLPRVSIGPVGSELVEWMFATVFGMRKESDMKNNPFLPHPPNLAVYINRHKSERQEGSREELSKDENPIKLDKYQKLLGDEYQQKVGDGSDPRIQRMMD